MVRSRRSLENGLTSMIRGNESYVRRVVPILNSHTPAWCRLRYPGHPTGCPNLGRRLTCPPRAPRLSDILDLNWPTYCVYNVFDLGSHVRRMRRRHPDWSCRRLRCCLYWQRGARKDLKEKVRLVLIQEPQLIAIYCPEACGVDVTATLGSIGIRLEWPPERVAYQVALVGTPLPSLASNSRAFARAIGMRV